MSEDTKVTTLDDGDNEAVQTTTKVATTTTTKAAKAKAARTEGDAAAVNSEPGAAEVGHNGRCIVTIHADKGDGGNQPVFVGVNGQPFLIPRGVPCEVPVEVAAALDDAQETVYDGGGAGRQVPRFAYSIKHL